MAVMPRLGWRRRRGRGPSLKGHCRREATRRAPPSELHSHGRAPKDGSSLISRLAVLAETEQEPHVTLHTRSSTRRHRRRRRPGERPLSGASALVDVVHLAMRLAHRNRPAICASASGHTVIEHSNPRLWRSDALGDSPVMSNDTGGGTGLGKEMAEGFLKLGAEVHICGRRGGVAPVLRGAGRPVALLELLQRKTRDLP